MKLFYPLGISYNFIWIFVCKRLVWQLGGFDALLRLSFHKITVLPLEDEACNLALGWAFLILFSPFYVIASSSSVCLFFSHFPLFSSSFFLLALSMNSFKDDTWSANANPNRPPLYRTKNLATIFEGGTYVSRENAWF